MKQTYQLAHAEARLRALRAVEAAPDGCIVEIREATRTLEQNALLWELLGRVARSVQWLVDGSRTLIQPDDWKQIFTAALKRYARMAAGIDGGVVMLGSSTSRMSKREFSDLIELIQAFCVERGVVMYECQVIEAHGQGSRDRLHIVSPSRIRPDGGACSPHQGRAGGSDAGE